MTSLMTTWPTGDGVGALSNTPAVALAAGTGWLCRSTPTILNWLVPGWSGILTIQFVTVVQFTGQGIPLNHSVLTGNGAVPLTVATSPVSTSEVTAKATLLTPLAARAVSKE